MIDYSGEQGFDRTGHLELVNIARGIIDYPEITIHKLDMDHFESRMAFVLLPRVIGSYPYVGRLGKSLP